MSKFIFIALIVLVAGFATYTLTKPGGTGYTLGQTIPNTAGIENAIVFGRGVISGSEPEDDAAFETLATLGVKSIISVDAARPNLEAAGARDMRYVHIPTRYDGFTGEQRLALAKAFRELPRPIYIHCHHGKHRGPAAAALGLICVGELEPAEGVELMRTAGTSEHYDGLYDDVSDAIRIPGINIDTLAPDELPEYVEVTGLAASMVEINDVFRDIRAVADNGWQVPSDHPDIELEEIAPRLPDLFRALADDLDRPANAHVDAGYRAMMREAAETSSVFEAAIASEDWTLADEIRSDVAQSCVSCHETYR
ncbi:MAG: hypothetical protein AAFN41_08215 [Planctomycetota bacterium]